MDHRHVNIIELADSGDERGSSFPVHAAWLAETFPLKDVHITTLLPTFVRGNHFHIARREILLVVHYDTWSLHWDNGEGGSIEHRQFDGQGAIAICVPPYCSHAIRNDGNAILHIVGLSNHAYDPDADDVFPRVLIPT